MKLLMIAFVASLQAQTQPVPTAPPSATEVKPASIAGTVYDAVSGAALAKANVTLQPAPLPGTLGAGVAQIPPQAATTDAQGHYFFTNITPGRYMLYAERQGFQRQYYGSRVALSMGPFLEVGAGSDRKELDLKMQRHAVVSGRILDPDGEPIEKAMVMVLRSMRMRGRSQYAPFGRAETNDLGEFRISGVTPGNFILQASSRTERFDGGLPTQKSPSETLIPTYYPGTSDMSAARPIAVAAGQVLSGLEFRMTRSRVYSISGKLHVTGSPRSYYLQCFPAGSIPAMGIMAGPRVTDDGTFEYNGLAPGFYTLVVLKSNGPVRMVARVPFEITRENIKNLEVTTREDITLAGNFRLEGDLDRYEQTFGKKPSPATMRLFLQPVEGPDINPISTTPGEDWKFKIEGVPPDRLRIESRPFAQGIYLKAVRLNGTDLTTTGVDLSISSVENLEVVVGIGTGSAKGRLLDEKKNPLPGERILFLQDPYVEITPMSMQVTTSNEQGEFEARNLAPGDYVAVSFEAVDPQQISNPDYLKQYIPRGTRFKVRAWESTTLDVQWTPARNN